MIVVCSDTHSTTGHELTGRLQEAVDDADLVFHAGDFTTVPALDAFQKVSARLLAVYGNADEPAVRERLPETRTVEALGIRIAMTHKTGGGEVGLATFGRSHGAQLVISGHTHRPAVIDTRELTLLNPGSHADPRGNRPGYAELRRRGDVVEGRLREPDGTLLEEFEIDRRTTE